MSSKYKDLIIVEPTFLYLIVANNHTCENNEKYQDEISKGKLGHLQKYIVCKMFTELDLWRT
jgi:hypothetical protein